jgi:hypothetical protein
VKYTRIVQMWIKLGGPPDVDVSSVPLPLEDVLEALKQAVEVPEYVHRDLQKYGESSFTDPESGERTVLYVYEFDPTTGAE